MGCKVSAPLMPHPSRMLLANTRCRGQGQMRFFRIYGRVLGLLGRDIRVAGFLAFANLMVAGLQFLDPVLFGRVVNLLSRSDQLPHSEMWHDAAFLLGIWVAVGIGGIVSNIA